MVLTYTVFCENMCVNRILHFKAFDEGSIDQVAESNKPSQLEIEDVSEKEGDGSHSGVGLDIAEAVRVGSHKHKLKS